MSAVQSAVRSATRAPATVAGNRVHERAQAPGTKPVARVIGVRGQAFESAVSFQPQQRVGGVWSNVGSATPVAARGFADFNFVVGAQADCFAILVTASDVADECEVVVTGDESFVVTA